MDTNTQTGTRLATDLPPAVGTASEWKIDAAHSLVQFAVKHMMFTTVRGRFTDVQGRIHCVDEADPSSASVEATIAAASIDTSDAQRDTHLRSPDFLDAEQYPTITFKSTRVEQTGEDQLRIRGDLTIRDVTREVALETTYNGRGTNPWGQEVTGFTAETRLNRKDFGLTWNAALESGGLLVGDKLDILIEIQAVKQSDEESTP
jgi:polyisoprenoid-binding protein YceI